MNFICLSIIGFDYNIAFYANPISIPKLSVNLKTVMILTQFPIYISRIIVEN